LPSADITRIEERKFDDLVKTTPLPSTPYRTKNELGAFDEMLAATPLPSQHFRRQGELADFEQRMASTPLPSQTYAASIASPAAAPETPAEDPVSKTLAYLDTTHRGTAQDAGAIDAALPANDTQPQTAFNPSRRYLGPTDAAPLGAGAAVGGTPAAGGAVPPPSGVAPPAFRPGSPMSPGEVVSGAAGEVGSALGGVLGGVVNGPGPEVNERLARSAREITAPQEAATEALGGLAEQAFPGTLPVGAGQPLVEHAGGAMLGMIGPAEGAGKLAKLAEEAATAPTSSAGFSQFWNRARNVIEAQGQAGKELGRNLHEWREVAERTAGDWTSRMPTVRKLSDADFRSFVVAAEGKVQPRTPLIAKAVDEWSAVRDEVYQRAKAAGLDIGHQEAYFPHVFEEGTFKGKGWSDAISHLVESGQAESRADAAQMLRYAQDVVRNRRYGNLEAERELNLPFYKRTKDVLFGQGGYLEAASNRIAQVETFGEKDVNALRLIDRIGQEGGDAGAAKQLFDISVGATKYGELQRKVGGALRGANTVASLGLSAITNVGQTANTAAVAGFGPTARNLWSALRSPEAREHAIRAGVTLDNVVQDVREGTGLASQALGKITAPGFGHVERFNRTLAFHAGIGYAEAAVRKAATGDAGALRALEKLGLDAKAVAERGTLTDAEKITAGRSMVERTQFKVDRQDLPGWASSPWGKVLVQFKTFALNQTAFLGREIIGPALKGDFAPLTRFMIAGLVAGAATTETKNLIQGRQPEQDPVKRILQYYQAAGGLGLVGDVLRVTTPLVNINADRLDPDRVVTQAVGTALGPSAGTAIEGLSGVAQVTRGNATPLERSALRRVPVIGTAVQNRLLPYKAPPADAGEGVPVSRSGTGPPKPPSPPKPPRPPKR
jgi:hypothetical protein